MIKGKAMISSYNSEMYEDLYSDWTKIELPKKKNNIRSGEVQEVIWINYPLEETPNHVRPPACYIALARGGFRAKTKAALRCDGRIHLWLGG